MNQKTEYILQVLEKIGSPLMEAILQAQGRNNPAPGTDPLLQDARKMAELLARTTQAGIEMAHFGIMERRLLKRT